MLSSLPCLAGVVMSESGLQMAKNFHFWQAGL